MANLISSSRAKQAIVQAAFSNAENSLIDALCSVVSALIRSYTRRELLLANHDELVGALTEDALFLRQYPITDVAQVSLASSDPLSMWADMTLIPRLVYYCAPQAPGGWADPTTACNMKLGTKNCLAI